jgi:hypothetical protein
MPATLAQCDGGCIEQGRDMHTDPHLYLQEHHRHVARVTEQGLRRLAAASTGRGRPEGRRLFARVARRTRGIEARPVTQ